MQTTMGNAKGSPSLPLRFWSKLFRAYAEAGCH